MGLLGNIFKKEKHKGYYEIQIAAINKLNDAAVKVEFEIPEKLKSDFKFIPGQYINMLKSINGKEERRSYSICSSASEPMAIGVKRVEKGVVSSWFVNEAKVGDLIYLAKPQGNFTVPDEAKNIAALAAGSGITPILSILKSQDRFENMELLYGNKNKNEAMFLSEIDNLKNVKTQHYFSRSSAPDSSQGRLDKESLTKRIKADLNFLQNDAFLICGPEEMILGCIEALEFFGVAKNKIIYELFTTPVSLGVEVKKEQFSGSSEISVLLDDESFEMTLKGDTKSILDAVEDEGMDAPYSCRGGVCCSCKAKVLEGSADMKLNYSLTDEEVADGYVLTCQAFPASPKLKISYDE
ncbi:MAG: 2Fe-2S iron-sulfur cluster-binding protein [Crocinitomicaceae bacterium]|nr:2Fe-2S iron-sulfur cluster-binding protein [Crocinitomicaceae bacterium]